MSASPVKLFVPILCYNHTVNSEYMMSMFKLLVDLQKHNITLSIQNIPFESLISRGRNAAVAMFMNDVDATHILFVDCDIEFEPTDILKLILSELPVVCGAYPQKWLDHQKLGRHLVRGDNAPLELSTKMSVHLSTSYANSKPSKIMEADYVTTGFLLIRKEVIVKMMAHYPQRKYTNDIDGYASGGTYFYDLFSIAINPQTKRYESEDYGFSRLWKEMGGKLYVITDMTLKHHGWFSYAGNLYRQLTQG